MSRRTLLVTERLTPSPRLAIACSLALGDSIELASFANGRAPASALAARMGLPHRALRAAHPPNDEAALLGACQAMGAERIIVWDCPRAALAFHAIRGNGMLTSVEYVLPAEGSSTWDEARMVAMRGANLVSTFHVEDEVTRRMLEDVGVPSHRIALVPVPEPVATARPHARVLVLGDEGGDRRCEHIAGELRRVGATAVAARPQALLAAALGWTPRGGTFVIADDLVQSWALLEAAAACGWNVFVTATANGGRIPDARWLGTLPADPVLAVQSLVGETSQ